MRFSFGTAAGSAFAICTRVKLLEFSASGDGSKSFGSNWGSGMVVWSLFFLHSNGNPQFLSGNHPWDSIQCVSVKIVCCKLRLPEGSVVANPMNHINLWVQEHREYKVRNLNSNKKSRTGATEKETPEKQHTQIKHKKQQNTLNKWAVLKTLLRNCYTSPWLSPSFRSTYATTCLAFADAESSMFAFTELSRIDVQKFLQVMFKTAPYRQRPSRQPWRPATSLVPDFLNVPDIRASPTPLPSVKDFGLNFWMWHENHSLAKQGDAIVRQSSTSEFSACFFDSASTTCLSRQFAGHPIYWKKLLMLKPNPCKNRWLTTIQVS